MTTDLEPKLTQENLNLIINFFYIGYCKRIRDDNAKYGDNASFIFTDFAIDKETLSTFTKEAVQESFNRISVDGDTSTSDTVFVATTNKKGFEVNAEKKQKAFAIFYSELKTAMIDLAKKIVMDGEGATKFVEVRVINARSVKRAQKICFSVANSILVKTAIAGGDANWGRIIMAMGKT